MKIKELFETQSKIKVELQVTLGFNQGGIIFKDAELLAKFKEYNLDFEINSNTTNNAIALTMVLDKEICEQSVLIENIIENLYKLIDEMLELINEDEPRQGNHIKLTKDSCVSELYCINGLPDFILDYKDIIFNFNEHPTSLHNLHKIIGPACDFVGLIDVNSITDSVLSLLLLPPHVKDLYISISPPKHRWDKIIKKHFNQRDALQAKEDLIDNDMKIFART